MDNENETRPLLHSFQSETWRSRARKKCMRIPSEITITGIILGLFLIVVTLLIVLENMESDKKDPKSLNNNKLLASPMKYNKKTEDLILQDNKAQLWHDRKAQLWQDKKDYFMKRKNSIIEEKNKKWDNVNKGWKIIPDLSASPMKFNKKVDDQSWQDKKDYMKLKERKLEEKNRKLDKIRKGWKKFPDVTDNVSDHDYEETVETVEDDVENMGISDLDEYGKEIDDSLEIFANLQMSNPSEIKKFREQALEVKNLLHSGINWNLIDDGWKALSAQGWREREIRRALFIALKEKREEIRKAELEGLLQSPMGSKNIWDEINDSWKKNLHEGVDNQKSQMKINDEWSNKFGNLLQSSFKKKKKNEEKKKPKDAWKNKNANKTADKTTDETTDATTEEPQQLQMNFDDFSSIVEAIREHQIGMDNKKTQMEINDEWKNTFGHVLQSSYKKWKKYDELKKKHSKDDENVNENENENENENDEPQQSPMNFDDFLEIIEAIKEHEKGMKEAEKQKDINDEWKNEMGILYSSKPTDKKWKQIDDHWKTKIEYERNSYFGRNDGEVTSSPETILLQNSMPFVHTKKDKMGKEWQKPSEQGPNEKDIKEAVYKAWKDGEKIRKEAGGYNDMKWKKVNNGYKKLNDGWKAISNKSAILPSRCPLSKFQRQFLMSSSASPPPIDCALIAEKVKRQFGGCIDLSFLPKECKPEWKEKCFTTYKYRKVDGTCNNRIHPTWGKSGIPFIRMIEPDYADGVSALRAAKDGGALPNPRILSTKLYSKRIKPNSDTSVLFMYFGLLVDHDMIETALSAGDIPCCDEDYKFHLIDLPPECLQIDIPKDDPFYGPKNVHCLNLVRSAPVNGECAGRREQLNKATAFLDGSVVYGSTAPQAKQLRTFSTGQLRTQLINNTPFMAYADAVGPICGTPNEPLKCFEAGDSRVNMMVELTAMHTLWYREHNRIAKELNKLNPLLRDEILYQEARRILIAELQHITYNEFLPLLLGAKAVEKYELKINKSKSYKGYDETVDPSIFNAFGAAAFRFGHSLVPDMQYLYGANRSSEGKVPLHETFFNVNILYHDGFDLLIRGAAVQSTQTVDSYVSPEVREHLFQPSDLDYGYDLAAVGIQRGRDHGLPGYIRWRSVCGLSEVKAWEDLYQIMDKKRADLFKEVYKAVEDIDLIPGALAEHHEDGSLVGPTYTCLLGRQFKKTRKGDRFWFENQNETGSLTKDQLDEIYKSTMARIVCDNSDNIKEIQRNPFKVPSSQNVFVSCDTFPKVDLSKWSSTI